MEGRLLQPDATCFPLLQVDLVARAPSQWAAVQGANISTTVISGSQCGNATGLNLEGIAQYGPRVLVFDMMVSGHNVRAPALTAEGRAPGLEVLGVWAALCLGLRGTLGRCC